MTQITLTEALAEIKLIEKKVESKKQFVLGNLYRFKHMNDPLIDGKVKLASEMQAIQDLYGRHVVIRGKIAEANLANKITIGDQTHSIHTWLTWKREVAEKHRDIFKTVHVALKAAMDTAGRQPQVYKDDTGTIHVFEIVTNLDYQDYVKKHEETQDVIEKLDGLLSLKNATVTIEI